MEFFLGVVKAGEGADGVLRMTTSGEKELASVQNVTMSEGATKVLKDGKLVITTHRIVWSSRKGTVASNLNELRGVPVKQKSFVKGQLQLQFGRPVRSVQLDFANKRDRDVISMAIYQGLQGKAWTKPQQPTTPLSASVRSTPQADPVPASTSVQKQPPGSGPSQPPIAEEAPLPPHPPTTQGWHQQQQQSTHWPQPQQQLGGWPPPQQQPGGWPPPQQQPGGWPPPQQQPGGWPPPQQPPGGWPPPQPQPGGWPVQQQQQPGGWPVQQQQQPGGWPVQQQQQPEGWPVQQQHQPEGWPVQQQQQPGGWPSQQQMGEGPPGQQAVGWPAPQPPLRGSTASAQGSRPSEAFGAPQAPDQDQRASHQRSPLDANTESSFVASKMGIGGVIAREKEKEQRRDATLGAAFTDLDGLMNNAKDLVAIAQRFQALRGNEAGQATEDDEFIAMMADIGIDTPVSKKATGRNRGKYLDSLAQELGKFLLEPLKRVGGVMTLTDVYCIYNRARSSLELVAPDDVLKACERFATLRIDLKLTKLDSKVWIVQSQDFCGEKGADRVLQMAAKRGSLSAIELASETNLPLQVALDQLQSAERLERLCRDEAAARDQSALRFYPNLFKTAYRPHKPAPPVTTK